jgi:Lysyl oxidase
VGPCRGSYGRRVRLRARNTTTGAKPDPQGTGAPPTRVRDYVGWAGVLIRLVPALLAAAVIAAAAALVATSADAGSAGPARLPDLDQEAPSGIVVVRGGPPEQPEYRLGFRSAVRNVGKGPLVIDGHRPDVNTGTMVADQVVEHAHGPRARVRGVGQLQYVVSPDHRHWHLLRFERYELRRPGGSVSLVDDRKTGFCLGDRYTVVGKSLPHRASHPSFTSRCGLEQTQLLGIREGISVGYGDDYVANLEGQYLPLTGLADGRYVLIHRVNGDRRIHEVSYGNNAASVLLKLSWRQGVPYVQVLARCSHGERCGG